jgi:small subunit ribosomal protein S6
MNHYETVFILNPVLSDVQETVSKFEDFLTTRGEMVSEDWGLKKWLTKFKTKKVVFYHLFEFKVGEVLIALKQNLDVTKDYAFLNCKFRQTRYSWAERRRTKLKSKKLNGNITTICFRKKDGDIRYLTPLNIETNKQKKYCRFKKSGINISIIKTVISY